MKIYIYRYGSICEPDIIDSFKDLDLTFMKNVWKYLIKILLHLNV